MIMEVRGSFWLIIVVVLSFGATVVCGQNGLLSARCAARCLKEHRDSLRGVGCKVVTTVLLSHELIYANHPKYWGKNNWTDSADSNCSMQSVDSGQSTLNWSD